VRFPFAVYGLKDLVLLSLASLSACALCAWYAQRWPILYAVAPVPFVVWLLVVNFFRDPERVTPQGEFLVIAPADGVVKDIDDVVEESFLDGPASRLGIFLSPLDVHVNRMPMDCTAAQVVYRRGKMLKAYDPLCITENESCATFIEVLGGRGRLIVRQVTGAVARRIVCPVQPGDTFRAGQRYGMIKFGSRTEVWVPRALNVRWRVRIGDRVRAGETVLGELDPSVPT
jgi:phosphatidylserine decarboxylase